MNQIPREFRRVLEQDIDAVLCRYLSSSTEVAFWLFRALFPACKLVSIEGAVRGAGEDHRSEAGNPLAYGQTDIEVIAKIRMGDGEILQAAALIENKVDARQGRQQGLRYRARGEHLQKLGKWDIFKSVLVAPQTYLNNAYPLGDFAKDGWDAILALDEIAQVMKSDRASPHDLATISEATERENAWNKPIPAAVIFWDDLLKFQRAFHPDIPVFADPQKGARKNVWPAFYENQLRNNEREVRRKRIQLAYPMAQHISLFVKKVSYVDFETVVRPLLEPDMIIGKPGGSWQSIQMPVPRIDPCLGVEAQCDKLHKLFETARRLYNFFLKHEAAFISIPRSK